MLNTSVNRIAPGVSTVSEEIQKTCPLFMRRAVADLHSKILEAHPSPVADPRGEGTPLRTKIFLISCSFFGKMWQICMLAPPPTRNPGSAPALGPIFLQFSGKIWLNNSLASPLGNPGSAPE